MSYLYQNGQTDGKTFTLVEESNYNFNDKNSHQYHPSDNSQLQWNYIAGRIMPVVDQYYPYDCIANYEYLYNSQSSQSDHFGHAQSQSYSQQQMNSITNLRNMEQQQSRLQLHNPPPKKRNLNETWLGRYNQLLQFKQEHGHVDVPQTYKGNKALGKWVGKQREMYKVYLHNRSIECKVTDRQPCSLNDERVEMLNKLGFRWAIGKGQAAKLHGIFDSSEIQKVNWEQKYNQLQTFKQTHGHLEINSKTAKTLDEIDLLRWIKTQRIKHKDFHENKINAGQVLLQRFNKLKDLGLDLNIPSVTSCLGDANATAEDVNRLDKASFKPALNRSQLWEIRYQALVQFVEKYGHANVSYAHDHTLARWIVSQREYYHDFLNDAKTSHNPLTEERIERMLKLGFEFSSKDGKFEDRLKELKDFSETRGHLNVRPWQNKPLYDWICRQRKYFKDFIEGKEKASITMERISQLQNIGFDWQYVFREIDTVPMNSNNISKASTPDQEVHLFEGATTLNESYITNVPLFDNTCRFHVNENQLHMLPKHGTNVEKWKINYEALLEFHRKHNHCRVPGRYKENPKLGAWVKLQREDYKHFKEGKKSPMNEWRIQMLENIGFEFSLFSTEERKNTWIRRLQELMEYRRIHGNCDVPQAHPGLGKWVAKIRLKYRQFSKGEDTNLTKEHVDLLTELGFRFSVGKGRNSWDSFFLDLLEFKRKHGHTHIPLNYTDDKALGFWAYQQRLENAKMIARKKWNSKYRTRLEKLREADFEFYSSPGDTRRMKKRKISNISGNESDVQSSDYADDSLVGVEGEEMQDLKETNVDNQDVVENSASV